MREWPSEHFFLLVTDNTPSGKDIARQADALERKVVFSCLLENIRKNMCDFPWVPPSLQSDESRLRQLLENPETEISPKGYLKKGHQLLKRPSWR